MTKRIRLLSYFLSFTILFCVTSCEKEVNMDLPDHQRKPVVLSLFSPDSLFKVCLTETIGMFKEYPTFMSGAGVYLFQAGEPVDTLSYSKSKKIYQSSSYYPAKRTPYQLKVVTSGGTILRASDSIPRPVFPDNIQKKDKAGINEEGTFYSQVNIRFQDPPGVNNYYEVKLFYVDSSGNPSPQNLFSAHDPVLKEESEERFLPVVLPFSDDLIDGEKYTLRVNYYPPKSCTNKNNQLVCRISDPEYRLIVCFRSVSRSYYLYKKQLIRHIDNQYGSIWKGSGNPVPMDSNIENGLGVFAGYSEIKDTIQ